MLRKLGHIIFSAATLLILFTCRAANAQYEPQWRGQPVVTQNLGGESLVTLRGNTRPEARPENDRGVVADSFPMEHMLLQLRRSAPQERAFEQLIDDLHTKGSPNYHHWTTARLIGQKYGPMAQEINAVTRWLESQGFKVNVVYPSGMVIDFSGTAGQVRSAFSTEIHRLEVNGEQHIANMSDPKIPASLAGTVVGVVSLHDFRPHPMHVMRKARPQFTDSNGYYSVVPADLATIYNFNPLFTAGTSGQGQTIVVIEDTDVYTTTDWDTFRSTFGLSSYSSGSFTTEFPPPPSGPTNCTDPGVVKPNDAEAILDAEWSSAAAPSAAIVMATCADSTTTFGGLIAVQNLINAVGPPPAIMSISYGQCEPVNGATANMAYYSAYQQAAAEGVSVFVAAGDSGAGGCDDNGINGPPVTHGIAVNAFASTPYNVAVGGTDFGDTYFNENSTYWNSTMPSPPPYGSALSYIPEIPWNDSCGSVLTANFWGDTVTYGLNGFCNDITNFGIYLQNTIGGGGGPSACATGTPSTPSVVSGTCAGWAKPSWQSVVGNPSDDVRDLPDVSLFAADGAWFHFYVFCWSDPTGGAPCTGDPSNWSGAGGTSFASPIMAGIQALVNQNAGARQGNPNPNYYALASNEYGPSGNSSCNSSNGNTVSSTCIFYDVTLGDMGLDCTYLDASDIFNCYDPDGTFTNGIVGVLSTSNSSYLPAFGTTLGWDFATGIGTVNATNLVNNWPVPPANLTGMWDLRLSNTTNPPSGQVGETEFTFDVDVQSSTASTEALSNNGLAGDTFTNSACVASGTGDSVTMSANFLPSPTVAFLIGVDNGESYSMSGALTTTGGASVTGTGVVFNSTGPNCGANDNGSGFTAMLYKPATGTYVGSFTPDKSGTAFSATIVLNEDGNYNLTGTVTVSGNPCFTNLSVNSGIAPSIASGDVLEFIGVDGEANQVGFVANAGGSSGTAGDTTWTEMFVTADILNGTCSGQTYTDAPFHRVSRHHIRPLPPPIHPIAGPGPRHDR
jgi:hypothetical protein